MSELVFSLIPILSIAASLQDPAGHTEESHYDFTGLTSEERQRVESLFRHILCDCKKEQWTRTLAGCPDACADRQKMQVCAAVKAGKSDEEVIAEQVRLTGTEQVKAVPRSKLAHLVPFIALGGLAVLLLGALAGSVRKRRGTPSGEDQANSRVPGQPTEEDSRLGDAVERDLAEMDE